MVWLGLISTFQVINAGALEPIQVCIVFVLHINLWLICLYCYSFAEEPANQRFSDVLLMQINTHARLACPDYQGPYLENPVLPDKLPLSQTSLHHSVWETLHKALGEGDMIKTNVWTTLGYKIGRSFVFDK